MAEAVVSFAVETIGNLLIEEAKFLHGVSDQVQQFQMALKRMLSFLRDADARQHEKEIIKEWISQARDLAYEADDLIERHAFKVASRRRKGIRSVLKRCVCILNECYDTHTIGASIQELKAKISDLTEDFKKYGIRETMERDEGSSSIQELRRTYSHVIEDDFVGLDEEVKLIVNHLVTENENHHFRVVSLYGMGGLGKSTLAKKVYNHSTVKQYFGGLVWVCISQKWQKEDILRNILTKLIPEKEKEIQTWRDEKLVRELFEMQQRKKYLLVLDDIWSADAWESIKQAFPARKDGTKILLTTRNKAVAEQIDPNGFHYQLPLLSDDESWELLQKKASRNRCQGDDHEETQEFEKLGKEMAKACGGLPLAMVVIGGILATKKSLNEWVAVYKHIKAHLERGNNLVQEQGNVHKILALSYNDLPYKLRPCFLYLGQFTEDSDIDAETLYQLWIAEGLISTKDRIGEESMMFVAERYLGELVQRCMVQAKAHEMPSVFNSFASCRLHDLMRDLCLRKAEEDTFLLCKSYDEIKNNSSLTHLQLYRLVICVSGEKISTYIPLEKRTTKHLRSLDLIVEDEYEGRMSRGMKSQFNQFKMLRVLVIEGLTPRLITRHPGTCKEEIHVLVDHWKIPKAIGKLIHLRYLCLSDSIFTCLPSSIGNLHHLETLDLRGVIVFRIPNVLWKLKQLRHLYLPEDYFTSLLDQPIYRFWNLIYRFWNLRLDGLNKLEILENFDSPICHIKDISKLTNLLALSAQINVEFGDPTGIIGYISSSGHLRRTSLHLSSNSSDPTNGKMSTAVGQCFSCHNLQKLEVDGPFGNLPKYEANFCPRLIELSLSGSKIIEDPMKTLEMLPNLRKLVLFGDCFMGKEMRCTGLGFCQLRNLYLYGLPHLEKWWVDDGAMPNLSSLTIIECKKLEMIPDGLRSITTLQRLTIERMPREFTDRVQVIDGREGADFHKVSLVPSISIL